MTPRGSSIPAVELDRVSLTLGKTAFVFDLALDAGELAAIIGPSGAGKSTLLALICGLEKPSSGHIRIDGKDVTRAGPADRPVSIIFQENNLFAHLDVRTNVGLGLDPGLRLDAAAWRSVEDALAKVGLAGFGRRMPGSLSGGERQRVALARGLARKRPILLMDEPFAALGPGLKDEMRALVRTLQRETGVTLLVVTHDPAEAAAIADTIVFVAAGRIAAAGPTAGFFERSDIAGLPAYLGRIGHTRA